LPARSDDSSDTFAMSLEQKGWKEQALEVTHDMPSAARYKSVSLHAEVKLTEALERCRQICPPTLTEEGDEKPSKLRTAVCCQVLTPTACLGNPRPLACDAPGTCCPEAHAQLVVVIEHSMPCKRGTLRAATHAPARHATPAAPSLSARSPPPAAAGRVRGVVRALQRRAAHHQRRTGALLRVAPAPCSPRANPCCHCTFVSAPNDIPLRHLHQMTNSSTCSEAMSSAHQTRNTHVTSRACSPLPGPL
jgi:hypothetical protein